LLHPALPLIFSPSIFRVGTLPFTLSANVHFVLANEGCAFPTLDAEALDIVPHEARTAAAHILKKRFFIFFFLNYSNLGKLYYLNGLQGILLLF
jgi:hypothetical protein